MVRTVVVMGSADPILDAVPVVTHLMVLLANMVDRVVAAVPSLRHGWGGKRRCGGE